MTISVLLSRILKLDGYGQGHPSNGDGTYVPGLPQKSTVHDVMQGRGVPLAEVTMTMLNGRKCESVAHEINNPLGTVLLYADILYRQTPEDNKQQREDLQMIVREATRCKVIVNDLLNSSRKNGVMAQETNLNDLLREMAEEVSQQDLYQQFDLLTDLEPDLPPIQADPFQLCQVFLNLMNNAAQAMPGGGRLTLRTWKGPATGFVTAQVQDTGVGISKENMKKLFTPFFTTKPIGQGTGLGLAIIYGIVKMHRGQISIQSQVGEGTTFTVTLRERLPTQAEKGEIVLQ